MWHLFYIDGEFNIGLFFSVTASALLITEKVATWIYHGRKGIHSARRAREQSRKAQISLIIHNVSSCSEPSFLTMLHDDLRVCLHNESETATARKIIVFLVYADRTLPLAQHGDAPNDLAPIPDMPPESNHVIAFLVARSPRPNMISVKWENEDGTIGESAQPYLS